MNDISLNDIEARLEKRKAHLLDRLDKVKRDVTSSHSADWSEQAQERQNDEVLDALGNESKAELARVNHALERIKSGDYTTCNQCGEPINMKRLEAVPYTDLCINCANAKDD